MEEVEACWFLVKPILREQQKPATWRTGSPEFRLLNLIGLTRRWFCGFTCIVNHLLERREKAASAGEKRTHKYCNSDSIAVFLCRGLWKEGRFLSIIIFRLSDPEGQFCTLK
ncbi:hypothetical protein HED63_18360 [Ochrobactrum cytisi]|nr:hypothetical protein [Brucella cytisi]